MNFNSIRLLSGVIRSPWLGHAGPSKSKQTTAFGTLSVEDQLFDCLQLSMPRPFFATQLLTNQKKPYSLLLGIKAPSPSHAFACGKA